MVEYTFDNCEQCVTLHNRESKDEDKKAEDTSNWSRLLHTINQLPENDKRLIMRHKKAILDNREITHYLILSNSLRRSYFRGLLSHEEDNIKIDPQLVCMMKNVVEREENFFRRNSHNISKKIGQYIYQQLDGSFFMITLKLVIAAIVISLACGYLLDAMRLLVIV